MIDFIVFIKNIVTVLHFQFICFNYRKTNSFLLLDYNIHTYYIYNTYFDDHNQIFIPMIDIIFKRFFYYNLNIRFIKIKITLTVYILRHAMCT